ncbi:MAG: sugar phosphate isomerase/epimerase [Gemmatimonadaceae bacterium]|nr:sugar phosphate isomerase/epimerase [Gemmatimonadaceae bacterium]
MRGPVTITGFADEIAADGGEQIDGLLAAGVRHVEVRALGGTNVLDLSDDETAAFRRRLEDAGIAVSSVGSPIGKTPIRSDLEAHFARFRIALRRADQLGCRFVRVFSFRHEGEEAEQVRGEVLGQMRRMTDAAAEAGITLVLENESRIYGDVPERCADLIESVGSPHLRGLVDPANFVTCGCDPLQAWERLADHVVWFHIKDKVAASDRVVPAGHGDGEVEAILGDALDRGFSGFLSIEPHLRANDPDFGGTGAERFAIATAALRRVLDRLGAREA